MRNNGWSLVKLNELGFVGRGKSRHRPRNDAVLYGGQYPFIQTADIMASDLYIDHYTQTYNETGLAQSKLWDEGTICLTIAGENTGEVAILKFKACFPDSIIGFIADPQKADSRFVKYYFDTMKEQIKSISRGATQDNLSLDKLLSFDLSVPPLPIQQQISDSLSAYDDLIENNTRRIKLLEEMTLLIYREWFVNFRFPGYERSSMVRSGNGPIPSGWQSLRVGDVLQMHIGGGWGEEEKRDGYTIPARVIRGTDIPDARMGDFEGCPLRFHKESTFKSRKLQAGDIVFEVSGGSKGQPVGRALLIHPRTLNALGADVICASFCKLLRPDPSKVGIVHLYEYLLDSYTNGQIEKYQVQSTGITNFKFAAFLEDARIVVPPEAVRIEFEKISRLVVDAINVLGRKNAVLRRSRDMLLPKLISGEISVEQTETEAAQDV
jgi:type I restriction enzyme S subunit